MFPRMWRPLRLLHDKITILFSREHNNVEPADDETHQRISSYFLGPKAENWEFLLKNILVILEGQRDARLDYYPKDGVRRLLSFRALVARNLSPRRLSNAWNQKFVTKKVQASTVFQIATRKVHNAVRQASQLLGRHSIPFW